MTTHCRRTFICLSFLLLASATHVIGFQPRGDQAFPTVPSNNAWPSARRIAAAERSTSASTGTLRPNAYLAATTSSAASTDANRAKPRTGFAQKLLNLALASPFWKYVLVPQARANIVKTAEANGIQWNKSLQWIKDQDGPWNGDKDGELSSTEFPDYYLRSFHAYEMGNLCWDAAFEQELAGRAVGARNFPAYGEAGEDAFRAAFDEALDGLGATVPEGATIIDVGCGTGTSTRRLAERFPQASKILGLDFSPFFIAVGKRLLELAPRGAADGGPWVTTVRPDDRIELRAGDAASTELPDGCADVVVVGLVVHELPAFIARDICGEAYRLLKPGGQLWLYEMDFDSPAFSKQRSNALLFSLIRSTEPFLDEYADGCAELRNFLARQYKSVKIRAATGRHYALVASKGRDNADAGKGEIDDRRFLTDGSYAIPDTHLKTWESKKTEATEG